MQDGTTIQPNTEPEKVVEAPATPSINPASPFVPIPPERRQLSKEKGFAGRDRRNDRKPRREPRAKPEFDQKIIDIRRVARVVSGGRRFSFAVSLVAGNRKGMVGVGIGKAGDTSLAIEKAFRNAKKKMIKINLKENMGIPHEVEAKYSSAVVMMMPARGKGIVAGSSVKDVLELAGVHDVVAKLRSGSKNRLNNAKVAVKALSLLRSKAKPVVQAQV